MYPKISVTHMAAREADCSHNQYSDRFLAGTLQYFRQTSYTLFEIVVIVGREA